EFRAHEIEHKETALAHGAEAAPAYPLLSGAIKAASRLAIWLSTRI
ncbi:MAG TPA: demethoxyubiquinone hydroxylase family protein, partial [Alphaproteobacteria bacterium]|nr:demethoxyubiquinone hydroxylase family protein [Alphaproteobacteria bacterium]